MKKIILAAAGILFSVNAWAGAVKKVGVTGMHCVSCAKNIEKAFKADPSVENCSVEFKKQEMTLTFKEGKSMADTDIKKILEDQGFAMKN